MPELAARLSMRSMITFSFVLACSSLAAQSLSLNPVPSEKDNTSDFDVVSIKAARPGSELSFGVTTRGYSSKATPLVWTILAAELSLPPAYWRPERVEHLPAWVSAKEYDIEAHLSIEDQLILSSLPESKRDSYVRPFLDSMLQDRCQLKVHLEYHDVIVSGLVVSNRALQLKPTTGLPASQQGIQLEDGGLEVPVHTGDHVGMRFYNTSLNEFAAVLSGFETGSQPVIHNATGLPGKYDFILYKKTVDNDIPPNVIGLPTAPDPLSQWDVETLGLSFKLMKASLPTVIVDHISPPTSN